MFDSIRVIGRGRVGSAVAERLAARGHRLDDDADLVVICVPDAAIAEVAGRIPAGPWVTHTSGATPLAALAPHTRRFSVHPLQTIVRGRGAEQLDGAWGAVTAEDAAGLERATWLAREWGLRPFELRDDRRALYHAGAVMASPLLVTLYRAAARALATAGAPPEALVPMMLRTIENGFEPTGPIVRGDWATVDANLAAIRREAPELEPVYRALADLTAAS